MFTVTGGTPVPLTTFGGLVLEAPAVSLSEGSSPLCWDVDFLIGDVHTRPGLFAQLASGDARNFQWLQTFTLPDGTIQTMCLDEFGELWVENVTTDPGTLVSFDTLYFPGTGASLLLQNESTFNSSPYETLTFPSITVPTTQAALIFYIDLNSSGTTDLTPPGGFTLHTPTSGSAENDTVIGLGSLTGTSTPTILSSVADAAVGILATFDTANIPTILNSVSFAIAASISSNPMSVTFANPTTPGSGIVVYIWGKAGSGAFATTVPSDINGNKFKLVATVTEDYVSLGGPLTLYVYYASNVGTQVDKMSCTVTAPDYDLVGMAAYELSSLGNFTTGSYAFATEAFGRQYICFGQNNIPRQWDGISIFDRISQEGPGGPPLVNTQSTGNPNLANITAYSVTSDVATFTATNTFSDGETVSISLPGTPVNGLIGLVTSESGSAFSLSSPNVADVSSTPAIGTATPQTSYDITSIDQPAAVSLDGKKIQWTSAPDANGTGTNLHIYYSSTQDATLAAAFAAGIPVYVYLSGMPGAIPDGTYAVTAIGKSIFGSNDFDYYFSVTMPSSAFVKTTGGSDATYQITQATITMASPIPDAVVGNQVSISGATPTAWDGSWTIIQAPNSGIFAITNDTMDGSGNITYTYTLQAGNTPEVGDIVTVTNTTQGGGQFNVINQPITATGTGTFTVAVAAYPTGGITGGVESPPGQAEVSGNTFVIDPGPLFVGGTGAANPIFGNDSGTGSAIVVGTALNISPGTRQCCILFMTENGLLTQAGPAFTFTSPANTPAITVQNIPIGPPDVIARYVAFTEAGANGVPGAFFYVIPQPVTTNIGGTTYTYASTVINDNITTTATFSFIDSILLSSQEIDIQGANQFNLVELGNSVWCINYANRMFYGLEQNKVQNFRNLSFQGGTFSSISPMPTGWTQDATNGAGGSLGPSSVWGTAYFISNTTGSTQDTYGMIEQNAFEDSLNASILQPNTLYSVRLTALCPSGGAGQIVVDLSNQGAVIGSFTLDASQLTGSPTIYTGTLLTTKTNPIPQLLQLRLYATNITNNTIFEIDRLEIFPTAQPVNTTQLRVSYANNPEAFDGITGILGVATTNTQPVNGAFVMYDILYLLKSASMFSTQDSPNAEPAQWDINEVSNKVGTCGPNAYDCGEEWAVTACRSGFYVFFGKQPVKISQEIYPLWEAINWSAASTIWVRNDLVNRRILIGVPMATPNAFLPNAPVNTNPGSPNVCLMLNYLGLGDVMSLADGEQMHTTMFGTLMSVDMRRKWSIWQIAAPYADFVTRQDGLSEPLFICNGAGTGKIYSLEDDQFSDDGAAINGFYTTYGWADSKSQIPLMQAQRKQWTYAAMTLAGSGNLQLSALRNKTTAAPQYVYNAPTIALQASPADDYERPMNITGSRVFLQFSTNAVGAYFSLQHVTMWGKPAMLQIRGSAAQ